MSSCVYYNQVADQERNVFPVAYAAAHTESHEVAQWVTHCPAWSVIERMADHCPAWSVAHPKKVLRGDFNFGGCWLDGNTLNITFVICGWHLREV